MSNRFRLVAALLLLSTGATITGQATPSTDPQAKPFLDFVTAIKTQDANKFRDAFSKAIRESDQPWAEKCAESKEMLTFRYGDCDLAKFVCSYEGDNAAGSLTVNYEEAHPIKLQVVKELDAWKLASH